MTQGIWIACGGTGGHFLPGVVMGKKIESMGMRVSYFGEGKAIEEHLQIAQKVKLFRPLKNGGRLKRGLELWKILKRQFKSQKPEACLLFGGFSSLMMGLYAKTHGIPIYIFEQNAIPGRINRLLSRWAKTVFLTFPDQKQLLKNKNLILSGNPVRASFPDELQLPDSDILILGGSQGAQSINTLCPKMIPEKFSIIHICGPGKKGPTEKAYRETNHTQLTLLESHENIPGLISKVKWVISRAGATSLSEIAQGRRALVAIPYPHAKDDHQTANATHLSRINACILLNETDLRKNENALKTILDDESTARKMQEALSKTHIADPDGDRAWSHLIRERAFKGLEEKAPAIQ